MQKESVEHDQTPPSGASNLGLHCLQMSISWDARHKRLKVSKERYIMSPNLADFFFETQVPLITYVITVIRILIFTSNLVNKECFYEIQNIRGSVFLKNRHFSIQEMSNKLMYSRLSLSRPRLFQITAYLEMKIWCLIKPEKLTTSDKITWKRG